MLRLPIFDALQDSQRILIAGAGGGFDIYCGLPMYFALHEAGKEVHLANLSFANIRASNGRHLAEALVEVTAETNGFEYYFPELHLCRWLRQQDIEAPIYAFEVTGVQPLRDGYETLVDILKLDTIILIDGGTDSLMRGDEAGLGTPVEDIASLLAVDMLDVPHKFLTCLGFGVDAFHGVCHAQFLEAVSAISQAGGFLGAWTLTADMPEVEQYCAAVRYAANRMPHHPSIVSTSIVSAIEGHFGDYHSTSRTSRSKLFINPLMALLWCFRLEKVTERLLYPPRLRGTSNKGTLAGYIEAFREEVDIRPFESLPM